MTIQSSRTGVGTPGSTRRSLTCLLLERAVPWILEGPACGQLIVETPNAERLVFRGARAGPSAQLLIHDSQLLWRLLTSDDVGFAESFMAGEWSTPELQALLQLFDANSSDGPQTWSLPLHFLRRCRYALNRNNRRGSRRNSAAHYDLGNAFYRQWLDPGMTYSSGLFNAPGQTLEQAQETKLDRVIELLELRGGEHILEIGAGWGSLAQRLAERHSCQILGVTLSSEQLVFARQRLAQESSGRCELRLQDYRDVNGTFDRIVSIEMLEAVGEAYWPAFFAQLRERLRPDGIAVLQVISVAETRFASYRRRPDFIQRYIFPGGMLPTPSIIERETARVGLQLACSEFFGASYARTLAEWQRRFQAAWPTIKTLGFDDRFKRMWEYYLTYCQVGFEAGAVNVGLYKLIRRQRPAASNISAFRLKKIGEVPDLLKASKNNERAAKPVIQIALTNVPRQRANDDVVIVVPTLRA
jgi:cyclopropane-fatty-acyl-phospholipid synthase